VQAALEQQESGQAGRGEPGGEGQQEPLVTSLARALAGAVIFALPLMMTMEMWWLGFHLDRLRLALLLVVSLPLLVGISHFIGFRETFDFWEDTVDALVACAVGLVASALVLLLLNTLERGTSPADRVGMVAIQAVPASMGALLARSQLGGGSRREREEKEQQAGYWGELFLMVVGALFLSLNLAPTEEMFLIAYKLTPWHSVALALVSLAAMHAFVYGVGFHGQADAPAGVPGWSLFLRFTIPGYALVLLVSLYVLWTFGRTDGESLTEGLRTVLVLGFPAAIGAAAARLIL
jgi:putative integral membrane protein (TIGR02587 family)